MPAAKKTPKTRAKKADPVDTTTIASEAPVKVVRPRKRRAAPTFAFALLDDQDVPGAINGPYANHASMLEDIAMSASGKSIKVVTYREAKRGTLTLSAKIA